MDQPKAHFTPEEYLEIERKAEYKSDYLNGEMFALAGTSKEHSIITINITRILGNELLGKRCQVFDSNLRVKVTETGLYVYPDLTVVCGEQKFDDNNFDVLLNPTIIIEILSKSTEDYDRGTKFKHYRELESLQ